MQDIAGPFRGLLGGILPLYQNTDFAYAIAGWMTLVAAALIVLAVLSHLATAGALALRLRTITSFISFEPKARGAQTGDAHEVQFARRFDDIDAALMKGGFLSGRLAWAWKRYRKTLTRDGAPPIRSTQRPNTFFYSAVRPPTWLGFVANLFVAFGLLATFVGLVAALTFASEGMKAGDVTSMQDAVRDLLAAASSKFVTSIAGVGLSIILRLAEWLLSGDLRRHVDRLSAALELGVRVDPDAHGAALASNIAAILARMNGEPPQQAPPQ